MPPEAEEALKKIEEVQQRLSDLVHEANEAVHEADRVEGDLVHEIAETDLQEKEARTVLIQAGLLTSV